MLSRDRAWAGPARTLMAVLPPRAWRRSRSPGQQLTSRRPRGTRAGFRLSALCRVVRMAGQGRRPGPGGDDRGWPRADCYITAGDDRTDRTYPSRPSRATASASARICCASTWRATQARREASALGSDDLRAAAEEIARIEVQINRLEEPETAPLDSTPCDRARRHARAVALERIPARSISSTTLARWPDTARAVRASAVRPIAFAGQRPAHEAWQVVVADLDRIRIPERQADRLCRSPRPDAGK